MEQLAGGVLWKVAGKMFEQMVSMAVHLQFIKREGRTYGQKCSGHLIFSDGKDPFL